MTLHWADYFLILGVIVGGFTLLALVFWFWTEFFRKTWGMIGFIVTIFLITALPVLFFGIGDR